MYEGYEGDERRRRRVFVTQNTEYHLFDKTCVVVRDMRSDTWVQNHPAVGSQLVGAFQVTTEGSWAANFDHPRTGEKLCFSSDVLTTPVIDIRRPERQIVQAHYPATYSC